MTATTTIPEAADIHKLALAAIPGHATRKERLARIDRFNTDRMRELNQQIPLRMAALQDAILAVADGDDVDVHAIAADISDMEAEKTIEAMVIAAADTARSRLRQETRDIDERGKDAALAWLDAVIRAVAAEVRELDAKLGSIGSWASASRGTPTQLLAWQRLDRLVETIDAIRHAQIAVVTGTDAGGPATVGKIHQVGFLADQVDHDRFWIRRRITVANTAPVGKHGAYVAWLNPWQSPDEVNAQAPLEPLTESWWPDDDKHAYLRWAATNATLWVPSISQANDALDAAMKAMQPTGLAAAHEYFRVTGTKPVRPLPDLPPQSQSVTGMSWKTLQRSDRLPERQFG
ncbi:hypothetical protein ACFVSU_02645 [Microbacterium sp. NPDC058062]|uniref:hypothetical protein n=1 Tax=Microbacterium sp. NPDC058062 TaxID=3346320 RepID=UPI0036DE489F